jgi:hypothetical protein
MRRTLKCGGLILIRLTILVTALGVVTFLVAFARRSGY